jgi:hypothetical protein
MALRAHGGSTGGAVLWRAKGLKSALASLHIPAIAGLALSVLSVSPRGLVGNLGAWTDSLFRYQVPLLALTVVVLALEVLRKRWPFIARLEYFAPREFGEISDVVPHGITQVGLRVLAELSQRNDQRDHIFRIIVISGGNVLSTLEYFVEKYAFHARWEIRVLIFDPEAQDVDYLGDNAKEDILAGCKRLAAIQKKAADRDASVTLRYRGYRALPMMRGCLLDEDHCFFGYFIWTDHRGTWKLVEQNKMLAHARRSGDRFSRDSVESFKTWFDFQWNNGRDLQTLTSI